MPLTVKTWNILKYVDFCGKAPLTLKVNCLCFQFVSYVFQLVSMFADKLEPSMQTMGDSINLLATKAIAKKLLVWHLFATEFTLFASTSNSRSSKLQNSSQCFISMEYPCTVLFMIYSGDWILVIKILLEIMTPYAFVYTDLHFFYRTYFSNSAACLLNCRSQQERFTPIQAVLTEHFDFLLREALLQIQSIHIKKEVERLKGHHEITPNKGTMKKNQCGKSVLLIIQNKLFRVMYRIAEYSTGTYPVES